MRLRSIVWVLAGCAGQADPFPPSPASFLDGADAVEGFEVLSSIGTAPHDGTVRAVNRFGAAVPSEAIDALTLDGVPVRAAFDGFGYAGVPIETPGVHVIAGVGDPVALYTVAGSWPGLPLHRAWLAPVDTPELAAAITTGGVVASGAEVWWAGEGDVPHRVLAADGPILGLRTGNIDVDGISDAIAWTGTTVYLLRGRSGGGLSWGGALVAPGLAPGGADVGDLSGDNLPDLVIAWTDGEAGTLDVWEGDGLFRFVPAVPRDIPGHPISLVVADNTGEGLAQVTVLHRAGDWSRFIRGAPQQYMPIGPSTPTSRLVLPADATLLRTGDINKDDGAEISIASRRADGVGRDFWFVDVLTDAVACAEGDTVDAQCSTTWLPLEQEPGAWAAMADGNGDYLADVFLEHTSRTLYAVAWDPQRVDGEYEKVEVMDLPAYGPLDLLDFDRDGEVDLFLAGGPYWWRWYGRGSSDLEVFWHPRDTGAREVREALVGPFGFVELDGDPATVEIVSFTKDEVGDTRLLVVQHTPGGGRAPLLGSVLLDDDGATPTDLAICGPDVYVAVHGDVHRVTLRDAGNPDAIRPEIAATLEGTATRIDCGTGPSDTQLAVLDAGQVTFHRKATLLPINPPVTAVDAVDIALGELGSGPGVHTCTTEGCSVVFWPWGAAGEAVFAVGDAERITLVDATGAERTLDGAGVLSVADLDGDGHLDLLALANPGASLVTLHRSTGDDIGPAELFHSETEWHGALQVADGDGDGYGDLWAVDPLLDLVHTVSPIAPAPSESASPGDTGAR